MTPVRFLPVATADAQEACLWYEQKRPGLGSDFIEALVTPARKAELAPGAGRLERDAPERFGLR